LCSVFVHRSATCAQQPPHQTVLFMSRGQRPPQSVLLDVCWLVPLLACWCLCLAHGVVLKDPAGYSCKILMSACCYACAVSQEAFAQLDKDGDGHLTPAELHAALRNTGALAKAGMAADIDPHVLEVSSASWSDPLRHCTSLQAGAAVACSSSLRLHALLCVLDRNQIL
jgi:hypothetical protein